jgi:hypothetical protein
VIRRNDSRRHFPSPAIGLILLVVTVAGLSARAAWDHWQYRAPIVAPAAADARLIAVVVPPSITGKTTDGWRDVRIVDDKGVETPYVLVARTGESNVVWRGVKLLEPSAVAGQFTQVVLDTGADPRVHNAVKLDIERDGDFLTWVELAVADDARTWRVVRDRGPVYDLTGERMGATTEVSYPESTSRYLRVRVLDGTRTYRVRSAQVADDRSSPAELADAGVGLVPGDAQPRRSVWVTPAGSPRLPLAAIRFETTQPAFSRPVLVETRDDDRSGWRHAASGEIVRMAAAATGESPAVRESLTVTIGGARPAALWRVTVYNRDDAPLGDLRVVPLVVPRRVVFRQQSGATYRLLYGNSRAERPDYDFGRLTPREAIDAAVDVPLGAEELNPEYADPAPWTERHAAILWTALVAAVLVLGALAIRSLRG